MLIILRPSRDGATWLLWSGLCVTEHMSVSAAVSPWARPWSTAAPAGDISPPGTSPCHRPSLAIQHPAKYRPPPAYSSADAVIALVITGLKTSELWDMAEKLKCSYLQGVLTPCRQSFPAGGGNQTGGVHQQTLGCLGLYADDTLMYLPIRIRNSRMLSGSLIAFRC